MSRFSQLIDEVADQRNHSLSDVLLKAKVLAHRLRSRKFREWINSEIDGYSDGSELPDYRIVSATLLGEFNGYFHSRYKNVPLSTSFLEPKVREFLETEPMSPGVAYIEDLVSKDGRIGKSLDIAVVSYLRVHGVQIEDMILNHVEKTVAKSELMALLASIRSRLLDFLLELRDKYPDLDQDEDAPPRIPEAVIDSAMARRVYNNCTVLEGGDMRDNYQAGQAGAMGPNAKAENMNFVQILRETIGERSLAELAADLERLRAAMLTESKTAEQDEAVGAIAQAEDAAKKGDAKGVLGFLRKAGQWAFDVATKIGTSVASKAIEKSMGM
jgi:hypothetical protein